MDSNETRHWYKLPVPLAWLCQLDEEPAANALADAFGDRYLYAHNPIFRQVRDAAIGFGYRFSSENAPLWRDYQAFPLMTLHRILREKTIPYLDTGATIHRLLEENRRVAVAPGSLISMLKSNHAFHESAHCVAHAVLLRFRSELEMIAPVRKDRFVLEAVFAESFATAIERLASAAEYMPVSDAVFYPLNSYVPPNASVKSVLEAGAARMGTANQFSILFLGSFEANLAAGPPDEETYGRVANAVECAPEHTPHLRAVTDVAFGLSSGFRENTNPMHFDWLGYRSEYQSLMHAKWLNDIAHRSLALQYARHLFDSSQGACQA